jgi:hypothetical protein
MWLDYQILSNHHWWVVHSVANGRHIIMAGWILNNELEGIWREAFVIYFGVGPLQQHLLEETENWKKTIRFDSVRAELELGVSRDGEQGCTHLIAKFGGHICHGRRSASEWGKRLSRSYTAARFQRYARRYNNMYLLHLSLLYIIPILMFSTCKQIALFKVKVRAKVVLRPTVSRPVYLGVGRPSGTREQVFPFFLWLIFRLFRVCWCGAPSLTRSRVCTFQFLPGIASSASLRSVFHWTH